MSEMVIQVHCTPFHMRKWKPRKVATDSVLCSLEHCEGSRDWGGEIIVGLQGFPQGVLPCARPVRDCLSPPHTHNGDTLLNKW